MDPAALGFRDFPHCYFSDFSVTPKTVLTAKIVVKPAHRANCLCRIDMIRASVAGVPATEECLLAASGQAQTLR